MDLTDIYQLINSNPIYQSIAVALLVIILYSILKKLLNLLIISLLITGIYVAYLYSIGDEYIVKTANEAFEDISNSGIIENITGSNDEKNIKDSVEVKSKKQYDDK